MNITRFLSVILLCLGFYSISRDSIISHKNKNRNNNTKKITEYFAGFDLPHIMQISASLILAAIFLYLSIRHFVLVIAIITIPGLIIYFLIIIFTLATTWKVIRSGERTQLKSLETNSLTFLGMIFSFLGIVRSAHFDAIYLESTASIIHVSILALEYSAYLFFIISPAFLLISDCCRVLIWCASKLSTKYRKLEEHIRKYALPHTRKCGLSVKLTTIFCAKRKWTRWFYILPMSLSFTLDVLAYLVQYVCIIVFWIPLFCLIESFRLICSFILAIARRLCAFSNRRITVIAFRLSIAIAMLLVVIMNRFGFIATTEATTAVLEFVASVLIIPIVLGWIQEALPNNKNTEQSNYPNCPLTTNTDKE